MDGFVFALHKDGKIMYISETASVHLGLPQIDLTGSSVYECLHPSDHDEIGRILSLNDADKLELDKLNSLGMQDGELNRSFSMRTRCILPKRNAGLVTGGYKTIHCTGYLKVKINKCQPSRKEKEQGVIFCSQSSSSSEDSSESNEETPLNNNNNSLPTTSTSSVITSGSSMIKVVLSNETEVVTQPQWEPYALVAVGHSLLPSALTEIKLDKYSFMFRANLDLKIISESSMSEHLGFELKQIINQSLYKFVHPSDLASLKNSHMTLLDKGQMVTRYIRLLRVDGCCIWVQCCSNLVANPRSASRFHHVVSICTVLANDGRLAMNGTCSLKLEDSNSMMSIDPVAPELPMSSKGDRSTIPKSLKLNNNKNPPYNRSKKFINNDDFKKTNRLINKPVKKHKTNKNNSANIERNPTLVSLLDSKSTRYKPTARDGQQHPDKLTEIMIQSQIVSYEPSEVNDSEPLSESVQAPVTSTDYSQSTNQSMNNIDQTGQYICYCVPKSVAGLIGSTRRASDDSSNSVMSSNISSSSSSCSGSSSTSLVTSRSISASNDCATSTMRVQLHELTSPNVQATAMDQKPMIQNLYEPIQVAYPINNYEYNHTNHHQCPIVHHHPLPIKDSHYMAQSHEAREELDTTAGGIHQGSSEKSDPKQSIGTIRHVLDEWNFANNPPNLDRQFQNDPSYVIETLSPIGVTTTNNNNNQSKLLSHEEWQNFHHLNQNGDIQYVTSSTIPYWTHQRHDDFTCFEPGSSIAIATDYTQSRTDDEYLNDDRNNSSMGPLMNAHHPNHYLTEPTQIRASDYYPTIQSNQNSTHVYVSTNNVNQVIYY